MKYTSREIACLLFSHRFQYLMIIESINQLHPIAVADLQHLSDQDAHMNQSIALPSAQPGDECYNKKEDHRSSASDLFKDAGQSRI